ncbi:MAG: choice-of-anchor L domain-containing protein, partial [Bacteroidia bacterium]
MRAFPLLKYVLAFALLLFISSIATQAQLVVNSGFTGQQLADTLSGRGVVINNVALNCAGGASGVFDGSASNIGIDKGVLLTTGNVNNAVGPNLSINDFGSQNAGTNDPILDFLSGGPTDDACALEFDITADCDIIQIAYVFASEEYPQFVNANFNDIFGFFVSGPGLPPGGTNIALIPGTTTPVSIDNVNAFTNNGFFVNNPTNGGTTIKYNGFTTPLLALIKVEPCLTYRIKLVIADGGDDTYDSGVFLDLGGIRCFQNRTAAYANYDIGGVDYAVEGCNELSLDIVRTGDSTQANTVDFLLAGTATNGIDYLSIPGNLTFPAFQDSISLNLSIPDDGIIEGMEFIELIIRDSICNTVTRDTLIVRIFDPADVIPGADTSICVNATLALPAQYSDSSGTISWTPTANLNDPTLLSPVFTPPAAGNYQFIVQLTDSIGCMDVDTIVVTVTPFALAQSSQDVACFGDSTGSLTATINGSSPYRFIWKDNTQTVLVDSTQNGGSQVLNNLPVGNYTVLISDAQGCTDSLTYVINQPAAALNASLTAQTNVDCNGANTGSATLAASDGTAPYQYSSDGVNFGNSPILGTLSAGTYSLVVRDANNCLFSVSATITEPTALVPSILNQINVDCNGNSTGSVDILASGGTMPYQY